MKINIKNDEKIMNTVLAVEGRCMSNTLVYQDFLDAIDKAETYLKDFPKKTHKGTKIYNNQSFPNSYNRGIAGQYTSVVLIKGSGDNWFLTYIDRSNGTCKSYGGGMSWHIRKSISLIEYLKDQVENDIEL